MKSTEIFASMRTSVQFHEIHTINTRLNEPSETKPQYVVKKTSSPHTLCVFPEFCETLIAAPTFKQIMMVNSRQRDS